MKREYAKPIIVFEDFTLTTSIASGCEVKTNLQAMGNCGWIPSDRWNQGAIFMDSSTGCAITPSQTVYDTLCYHVPTESYNLFNS